MSNSLISKLRPLDWCIAMAASLFIPYAYIVVVELWYYSLFVGTRTSAEEHYTASHRRYLAVSVAVGVLSLVYIVLQRLYEAGCIPSPQVYAISRTVLLFVCILVAVWQIVILLNAYSYAVDGDNFKNSRARYLLLLILAPIGTFYLRPPKDK